MIPGQGEEEVGESVEVLEGLLVHLAGLPQRGRLALGAPAHVARDVQLRRHLYQCK